MNRDGSSQLNTYTEETRVWIVEYAVLVDLSINITWHLGTVIDSGISFVICPNLEAFANAHYNLGQRRET
ncbi:uncharacterized protein Bfra_001264 [Botrytis fragariae]|uniref:Uncharacterized protein n=1 Tax=Botrytis fragariae TaxID=1964551 RepID=A0A8H6B0K0_9HELO|nr:uncharacterized protein Bfra_001264 [Botrytis fragariae]KAF5876907.1 hypothetical protein Bfra_001264 [Botrytis fragariae]